MEDDEVVDLTALTPRSEICEIPLTPPVHRDAGEAISLLTPSEAESVKRPPEPRELQPPAAKKFKEESNPRNDHSSRNARSRSPSPVTDSLRRFLASRKKRLEEEGQPSEQVPEVPSGGPVESVTKEVVELSLKKGTATVREVPKRRQLCAGKDDIIVEICHETEGSAVAAKLINEVDELEEEKKSFCCFVHHESLLPGRKCITWLKKVKKRTSGSTTHEQIPYLLVAFEADEFLEEIQKDRLESFLFKVSRSYPECRLGVVVIGLDSYMKSRRKRATAAVSLDVDAWLADVFVKYSGVTYHMVADAKEAATHIVEMSHAFSRTVQNKYDLSYLAIFGGCKSTEAINIVDLKLSSSLPQGGVCTKRVLEWINLLHAIPGIGPRDAHAIALKYPSFASLMAAYASNEKSDQEKKMLVSNMMQPPDNVRRIGTAASAALHKFFCNDNPESFFDA